jgi:outer membrane protein
MTFWRTCVLFVLMTFLAQPAVTQSMPESPGAIWKPPNNFRSGSAPPVFTAPVDPNRVYSLAELIDIAEQNNPETRIVWEQAKQQAAQRGIARSALYPLLATSVLLEDSRSRILINSEFILQDEAHVQPTISLFYTIFDFGERASQIEAAEANLLAADFSFNETHERIIFDVSAGYYQLISAQGEIAAAEATLTNAQTVQSAAEERLKNGVATLPDVLEARAATAQAAYDLETARGVERVARGNLAGVLSISPTIALKVRPLNETAFPSVLEQSVEDAIERAFKQRPELLAQQVRISAAQAAIKGARSQYYPTLSFSGAADYQYLHGSQPPFPSVNSSGDTWLAQLSLRWTLFDGGKRRNDLDRAESARREAQAQLDALRNQAAVDVWTAYSDVQTAVAQQKAAAALLDAADRSYEAATEAYGYGVRSLIDVVAAERALAQARTAQVVARARVLTAVTNFAFQTGDLLRSRLTGGKP